jgi:hypothetical protein
VFGMDRNAPWSRFVPNPASFRREWILEHGAPCHISGLMVHRSVTARFPEWTGDAEDVIYYLELVGQAKIKIVPLPLVLYRVHPRGQTSRPDMGERRDATLQKWLQLHLEGTPNTESFSLRRALLRRKKWAMLCQGHSQRQRGLVLKGLLTYSQVLWQSLYSPTSSAIVTSGLRSTLGAIRDSLRLRSRTLPS